MVKRCAVQFSTDSNKTGHPMQIFPNDANLKRQFVKFVQVKIADSVEPFEHSVICSSYFFFLVLYRRFRPYQKQIIRKYKNDPYSR